MGRLRIGEFLVNRGALTTQQVDNVLLHSETTGLRFGESAMDLGYLNERKMLEIFGPSFRVDFFHLNPAYFPESTKSLFSLSDIVRLGFLPLGIKMESKLLIKRRMLNIGILNPSNQLLVSEIKDLVAKVDDREKIDGIKTYLILTDQFIDVLDKVYEKSVQSLQALEPSERDDTLSLFLER